MEKRNIQIRIDSKGDYILEAGEGFSGESCIEGTKDIELVLGGTQVDGAKKDSYYDGESSSVLIDLDN